MKKSFFTLGPGQTHLFFVMFFMKRTEKFRISKSRCVATNLKWASL